MMFGGLRDEQGLARDALRRRRDSTLYLRARLDSALGMLARTRRSLMLGMTTGVPR